jgi:alpha-tubulin suppressor-like RCC1 family protein
MFAQSASWSSALRQQCKVEMATLARVQHNTAECVEWVGSCLSKMRRGHRPFVRRARRSAGAAVGSAMIDGDRTGAGTARSGAGDDRVVIGPGGAVRGLRVTRPRCVGRTDPEVLVPASYYSPKPLPWAPCVDSNGSGPSPRRRRSGRWAGVVVPAMAVLGLGLPQAMATISQVGPAASLAVPGPVWAWGANSFGELADGTRTPRLVPESVGGLTGLASISSFGDHSVAVAADGTAVAWGDNAKGEVGDGTTITRQVPTRVKGLRKVAQVATGSDHSLAVTSDGRVWAWGSNAQGELGDRTAVTRTVPVPVGGLSNVAQVAAGGGFSVAVEADGSVWAWGDNAQGQLADGTLVNRTMPVRVKGPAQVVAVAAATDHTLVMAADGTVWAWGDNSFGALGDGSTNARSSALAVPGLSNVTGIAAGLGYSVAVRADGSVWAWGLNSAGQLGDGTTLSRPTPAPVAGLAGVVSVAAGTGHGLAVKADGSVWGWGDNSSGQLGDGTTMARAVARPIAGLPLAVAVIAGDNYSLAIGASGSGSWLAYRGSSRLAWATAFADNLGAGTQSAVRFVLAWSQVEGASARQNNPLNTTMREVGARVLRGSSAGVKIYPTLEVGLKANLDTIGRPAPSLGYGAVVAALRAGDVASAAAALQASKWCYDPSGPGGHECPGYGARIVSLVRSYGNAVTLRHAGAIPAGTTALVNSIGGLTGPPAWVGGVPAQLPQVSRAMAGARAQLGKPYVWGGNGPDVFDCSGLMVFSWGLAGVRLPRVAADQQAWAIPVTAWQARPGDLVFFGWPAHHVGMYLGNGLMIDAPHPGATVEIASIAATDMAGFGRVHQ